MWTKRNIAAFVLILAVGGTLVWALRFSNPQAILRSALQWIADLGIWAPVLFILAYVVACLIFFPAVVLTLGAGVLFGVVKGTLYVAIGSTLGGCAAFTLARFFARNWVTEKFGKYEHFKAIDEAVAERGWKIVGLMRLSPVFPFLALNFLFGLTKIPFLHYMTATFFGMIPLTAAFVYIGKLAGDLVNIAATKTEWTPVHYGLGIFGLITTVIVSTYITNVVRRALRIQVA